MTSDRMLEELLAERNKLREENEKLKTVMIAAAEEIAANWDAHCDAEGYGPINLMRRLEEGIPSKYDYTAGDFNELYQIKYRLTCALNDLLEHQSSAPKEVIEEATKALKDAQHV